MKLQNDNKIRRILPITVVMFAGIVLASVFVYNPMSGQLLTTTPAIIFQPGTNAGQADLGGNTITVLQSPSQTSATVELHPTYQKTYYKDVIQINNTEANTYYIILRVIDPLSDTRITQAKAYIYDTATDTLLATVDLTLPGNETPWITMNGNAVFRVDFEFVIADQAGDSPNTPPSLTDSQFTLDLIYSTSNIEAAP